MPSEDFCEHCGEPLDDFSPCACSLDGRKAQRLMPRKGDAPGPGRHTNSMREMVRRKLERQRIPKL